MKTVTHFPRDIVEQRDVGIVMPDGCRLSARIWMPKDAHVDPVPAILEHLPYRKRDGTTARDQLTHPWFAGHGYASIRVDIRGNGDSEGLMEDEYSERELQDACDVIAWAAAQPWCNGNVGMMGISWGGFNSLQVAAMRPPALKAIITLCSTVDRYADDIHYKGGCLLGENFGWGATMLSHAGRPPDPAIVGDRWREMWIERLEKLVWLQERWFSHQHRDLYWKRGSVCEDFSAIDAAVLSVGGWHDGYRNTISHLVANLSSPVKGIVGPWIHKYPHFAKPEPAIGFLQEAQRWWDRWLKGMETGVDADPAYRVWLMDSVRPARWHDARPGRWIAEKEWPARRIGVERTVLLDLGDRPRSICSPQDCGLTGGEYFPYTYGPELPGDQIEDDARSLCFDLPSRTEAIDIVGAASVSFEAESDRPQANAVVRLCDLRPDGTSELIAHGVLNLCHRTSHETPTPLSPGQRFPATVTLDQCAYRLAAGHRLRVAISTACWPLIWPSPEAATLTLHAATLSLPLRPLAGGDEWRFETPEAAAPWKVETLRKAASIREVVRDAATGRVTLAIEEDFGAVRDVDHGLESGSRVKETWTIDPVDPRSAECRFEWSETNRRGDWQVEVRSLSRLKCDADYFFLDATIEAYEAGERLFQRDFSNKIRRRMV